MRLYVDEHGSLLRSSELRHALRSNLNPEELSTYVVTNMGYVAVEERRGTAWLRLRPRGVSQVTLAAVLFWLGDRPIERAVISHYDRAWRHEVIGPAAGVLARLGELVVDPLAVRGGDFHRKRHGKAVTALAPLMQLWHRDPAAPFSDLCRDLLHGWLGGRYMVLKRAQWSRRLEICAVGRGFVVYDDIWLANAVGRRFEDQPDPLYARWAAKAYYDAGASEQAVVDDIDALICRPGRDKARLQYQRAILPYRQPSGDQLLLCASLLDRSIDLRGEAA